MSTPRCWRKAADPVSCSDEHLIAIGDGLPLRGEQGVRRAGPLLAPTIALIANLGAGSLVAVPPCFHVAAGTARGDCREIAVDPNRGEGLVRDRRQLAPGPSLKRSSRASALDWQKRHRCGDSQRNALGFCSRALTGDAVVVLVCPVREFTSAMFSRLCMVRSASVPGAKAIRTCRGSPLVGEGASWLRSGS